MKVSQPGLSQPVKLTSTFSSPQSSSSVKPEGTILLKSSKSQPLEADSSQQTSTSEDAPDAPEQKEQPPTEDIQTEVAYAETTPELPEWSISLEYQHRGFFHYWYRNFFVINTTSVNKYPNENRNESKRKEIFLYDAVIQVRVYSLISW